MFGLGRWRGRRKLLKERRVIAEERVSGMRARYRQEFERLRTPEAFCDPLLRDSIREELRGLQYPSLHDPIEDDPAIRPILEQADALAEAELKHKARGFGFCYLLWRTKKRILFKQFGITWFSPDEMNPGSIYD